MNLRQSRNSLQSSTTAENCGPAEMNQNGRKMCSFACNTLSTPLRPSSDQASSNTWRLRAAGGQFAYRQSSGSGGARSNCLSGPRLAAGATAAAAGRGAAAIVVVVIGDGRVCVCVQDHWNSTGTAASRRSFILRCIHTYRVDWGDPQIILVAKITKVEELQITRVHPVFKGEGEQTGICNSL